MHGGLTIEARAKINLSLHVEGRRADGYHLLSGMVAFADIGDRLTIRPDVSANEKKGEWQLVVRGPFAGALADDIACLPEREGNNSAVVGRKDNLVLKAAERFCRQTGTGCRGDALLVKNLPVASGMGGGSSDAAAMLAGLNRLCGFPMGGKEMLETARTIGADVPMCLEGRAGMVSGIGDVFCPLPAFEPVAAVLVNPGCELSTANVFAELNAPMIDADTCCGGPGPEKAPSRDELFDWLAGQHNDLEAPALRLAPVIGEVLEAVGSSSGCRLARMSGSGATCFGLYDDIALAREAAEEIGRRNPCWWIRATLLS